MSADILKLAQKNLYSRVNNHAKVALDVLAVLAQEGDPDMKEAAANTLLEFIENDDRRNGRQYAIYALLRNKVYTPAVLQEAIAFLFDGGGHIEGEIHHYLSTVPEEFFSLLWELRAKAQAEGIGEIHLSNLSFLITASHAAVSEDKLAGLLEHGEAGIRADALKTLCDLCPDKKRDYALRLVQDPSAEVQHAVLEAWIYDK